MSEGAQSAPLRIAPKTAERVPEQHVADLEDIVRAARDGEVTGFVIVAIGPDFTRWRAGHVVGTADRHNLLGQLLMSIRQIEDIEQEEGG